VRGVLLAASVRVLYTHVRAHARAPCLTSPQRRLSHSFSLINPWATHTHFGSRTYSTYLSVELGCNNIGGPRRILKVVGRATATVRVRNRIENIVLTSKLIRPSFSAGATLYYYGRIRLQRSSRDLKNQIVRSELRCIRKTKKKLIYLNSQFSETPTGTRLPIRHLFFEKCYCVFGENE